MTNYAKGARAEKKTHVWLERQGYTVIESRGSHGAVDLVAVNRYWLRLIQVKSGRKLSAKERTDMVAALKTIEAPPGTKRELVTWTPYAREPEVEAL